MPHGLSLGSSERARVRPVASHNDRERWRSSSDLKPERFGRYVLLDRIDVGGMAEVFRGRMGGVDGFERMVALKRILPNIAADPDFVEMFVEEAKLAVQLRHANIAQIFELGLVDKSHFIAMEYVSGVSLRTMWDRARGRNRLLPIAMSCHIVQKVCEGLDAAHRKKDDRTGQDIGLVHRDVSPQNVLVSFEGEVKVIDFGIAKAATRVSKTQAGVLKGKFGYMSPEQVRGYELDNRSDIFACGVVLYELFVGDRLFLGESDFSTLEKVRNVEMVPPTRLNKNLSPHLERIVMKALCKNREGRYRWASEMAEDLQRYLFATNQPFARTDLQRYMQQHFKAEMGEEKDRLAAYAAFVDEELPEESGSGVTEAEIGLLPAPSPGREEDWSPQETATLLPRGTLAGADPDGGFPSMPLPTARTQSFEESTDSRLPTWAAVTIGVLATVLVFLIVGALLWSQGFFKATGGLAVTFEPRDARFFLDDRLLARGSPVTLEGVPAGTHVVSIKRVGFEDAVRPVHVVGGETHMVTFRLDPLRGGGILIVRSEPSGLEVWLDGSFSRQRTPARVEGLAHGEHALELRREDGALVHRTPVKVRPGAPEKVDVRVAELPPVLDVASTPAGAEVRVNGLLRGRTPLTVAGLEPGSVRVELRKEGCERIRVRKRVDAGLIAKVEKTLSCPE